MQSTPNLGVLITPFDILADVIAPNMGWQSGIDSPAFKECFGFLAQDSLARIDCGIALSDKAFDVFGSPGHKPEKTQEALQVKEDDDRADELNLIFSPNENSSLAYFVFRLLSKLQSMGTAPAADWSRYAESLVAD